ncbi:hypothetical protein HS088_TW14G00631 [Tripterygium wilfordii]|uniref:Protein kinase domain-containing protein n=1 Tax=Tripterygium wilfordii TaxID=458696 RepID=A0A7J7CR56_TRIWF|nr:probable inactive receptor kinase At5g58300 [Tripterygium wilfordii]XP_038723030.1 probable inactive receptor kinase At5g58300 [Tripterygium wilfordii]XP_038723031.1 probable inactive receptor kinase At5g58300 [Tripterygium wilfordii]XP_038723032.1 probable inactive receptor kinase At5g58300 [Tripterygium wilfordii]KAF5736488.1 hypothetical protein HS088_TW14G00631 [Tripterygium wilfordii]
MKLQSSIVVLTSLFLLLITPLMLADLSSDKQALLDFAAAVPHVRNLNWTESASICSSWIGVTCNVNKTRVTGIRLPGVGLYGDIPANTIGKLDALRVLSLRSNHLNGHVPSDIPSIPALQYLYLQHNNFSGIFPAFLSPQLIVLDVSFNSFFGSISPGIQNLTKLVELYIQDNSFSGAIPNISLPMLKIANLSNNKFNGSIPHFFQNFPTSSFTGNSLLCGLPLKPCSRISSSPSPSPVYFPIPSGNSQNQHATSRKKLGTTSIIAIAIGGSAVLFLLLVVFFICCLKREDSEGNGMLKSKTVSEKPKDFGSGVQEAEKNKLCFFEGCSYNFDLEDLLRASAEVLGKGSYGTAYKAVLDDGTTVVVKRLKEVVAGKKEFEQQMELIGRLGQHPNIISLRAYYYSKDEKLLVYNYMTAGSLFSVLHGNIGAGTTPLDWDSRVKISLSAARGIAHIHSEGGAKCIHGNIKSSNVLLAEELDGCISDLALTPLLNFPSTMSRTIGYRAPEVTEARKITHKSDVYSFGVLLLEVLTGKAPIPSSGGHEDVVDLPRWVRSVVREEWTAEVFDVELLNFQNSQEEMVEMLQVALACVSKVPDMRPKMDEVVRMMEEIQQSGTKNRQQSTNVQNS